MNKVYSLHEIEDILERSLDISSGRPIIKVLIAREKDLKIILNTNDHNPPHFHVNSTQRNFSAKFDLYTFELLDIKGSGFRNRDIKIIQDLFLNDAGLKLSLQSEYDRINR